MARVRSGASEGPPLARRGGNGNPVRLSVSGELPPADSQMAGSAAITRYEGVATLSLSNPGAARESGTWGIAAVIPPWRKGATQKQPA